MERLRYRAFHVLPYREGEDLAFPYRKALGVGYIRITEEFGKNIDVGLFCEPRPLLFVSSPKPRLQNHCLSGEQREITDEKSW